MAFVVSGLASGALHAIAGPDHVLGLVPLALGQRRAAWRIGLVWGTGHAIGTAAAGALLAALASAAQMPVASVWGDRLAGAALVAVGLAGLARRARRAKGHGAGAGTLLVGLVHGATGAAGLLFLAPAALAGDAAQAAAFLVAFGLGSTLAMAALTAAVAAAGRVVTGPAALVPLARGASALSVALGLGWLALA